MNTNMCSLNGVKWLWISLCRQQMTCCTAWVQGCGELGANDTGRCWCGLAGTHARPMAGMVVAHVCSRPDTVFGMAITLERLRSGTDVTLEKNMIGKPQKMREILGGRNEIPCKEALKMIWADIKENGTMQVKGVVTEKRM
ncbi:hypothetical protein E3N88_40161 [Mikania micrantha]|uniref:Uncharacterized protein n=1 Tax=Mikania micrantha TaxID=192012 RepID=A0A5N6L7T9_9ASTR|nr:hypothetical protein E3N88_45902 [Mikania micrantha]KAD2393184.1 hypothetical protein E3N88_40161 [Mikania micrantha]